MNFDCFACTAAIEYWYWPAANSYYHLKKNWHIPARL